MNRSNEIIAGLTPMDDGLHIRIDDFSAIIHPAVEGGYWAEVPALPGCLTQGETLGETVENIQDAI